MPVVLQKLMRHSSIETTLRYYVDLDADEVGDELWKSFGPAGGKRPAEALPHTLPHTCPDWGRETGKGFGRCVNRSPLVSRA